LDGSGSGGRKDGRLMSTPRIVVGVGGWTYEPWRGTFYPADLPKTRELDYAGAHLTGIEINGTFYRAQGPKSFAKWRDATPEGFVFAVKGHRAIVNKKKLAEAGESLAWFFDSGIAELGDKLGPVLWQLAPFKRFDAEDFGAFLAMLPETVEGLPVRHAVEVRHKSFQDAECLALARQHNVAIVYADSDEYPGIADDTADFVYARLMRSSEDEPTGYSAAALDAWAERARAWAGGGVPDDLPRVEEKAKTFGKTRPVYLFFIAGAKVRNPAAAQAMIERLGR
jgi:uncharacterized protein YecE (DUF72 family)